MTEPSEAAKAVSEAAQERIWRAEEKAEWASELDAINQHRADCLCRAVRDWSPGPQCFQRNLKIVEAQ